MAGSRKGIPNKSTARVRAAVSRIAEQNIDKVQDWIEAIDDPKQRLDLFIRLLEYHIPKLARVESKVEVEAEVIHKIESVIVSPEDTNS